MQATIIKMSSELIHKSKRLFLGYTGLRGFHRGHFSNVARCRSAARQWAIREGFNSEKLTEFGHLMAMVLQTIVSIS